MSNHVHNKFSLSGPTDIVQDFKVSSIKIISRFMGILIGMIGVVKTGVANGIVGHSLY